MLDSNIFFYIFRFNVYWGLKDALNKIYTERQPNTRIDNANYFSIFDKVFYLKKRSTTKKKSELFRMYANILSLIFNCK